MKLVTWLGAVIFTVLFLASTSLIAADPAEKIIISPNDKRTYKTLRLSNELEVLLVSDPDTEKSAAALSVGIGLLFDPMTQQGMAHYLEHMLFLGSEKYPDTKGYREFMTSNGGRSNAYTWIIGRYLSINQSMESIQFSTDLFPYPVLGVPV